MLAQIMASSSDGTNPLPGPMLTSDWWGPTWHSPQSNFTVSAQTSIMSLKVILLKLLTQLPYRKMTSLIEFEALLCLRIRTTGDKFSVEKYTCNSIQWHLYNETREVLLKTHKFQHLSGTVFTKSCLFSLSWETTCLERPQNLVVALYSYTGFTVVHVLWRWCHFYQIQVLVWILTSCCSLQLIVLCHQTWKINTYMYLQTANISCTKSQT